MALAGIPVWRIQVFGRWGSLAILSYLRETILEGQSETLAAEVEAGLSSLAPEIRARAPVAAPATPGAVLPASEQFDLDALASGTPKEMADPTAVKRAIVDFLEKRCGSIPPQVQPLDEAPAGLDAMREWLVAQIKVLDERLEAKYDHIKEVM